MAFGLVVFYTAERTVLGLGVATAVCLVLPLSARRAESPSQPARVPTAIGAYWPQIVVVGLRLCGPGERSVPFISCSSDQLIAGENNDRVDTLG